MYVVLGMNTIPHAELLAHHNHVRHTNKRRNNRPHGASATARIEGSANG
jgi:hypothetical protein